MGEAKIFVGLMIVLLAGAWGGWHARESSLKYALAELEMLRARESWWADQRTFTQEWFTRKLQWLDDDRPDCNFYFAPGEYYDVDLRKFVGDDACRNVLIQGSSEGPTVFNGSEAAPPWFGLGD